MSDQIPTLDLHGVKHADAHSLIEEFITVNDYCKVITGNSKAMKRILFEVLSLYKFGYMTLDDYNLGQYLVFKNNPF